MKQILEYVSRKAGKIRTALPEAWTADRSTHARCYSTSIHPNRIETMKSAAVFLALVATASAFNAPMMATRAVGKGAPALEVCHWSDDGNARHVPWKGTAGRS